MKRYLKFVLIAFFLMSNLNCYSTSKDTLKSKTIIKKSIVPLSLIGIGVLINKSEFEKKLNKDILKRVGENYKTRIDDYILFAPVVQMYSADILGVKSKNHWFDQSKYLFISNVIATGITDRLKKYTNKSRPSGSSKAFPSGHTTIAFTNATVLYNEFIDTSPLLAYSGFAFAAGTGTFRMINNKHWVSDVLVGAGIGMIITHLVYHFEPLKNFNPFKKSDKITFFPTISNDNYGLYFTYNF